MDQDDDATAGQADDVYNFTLQLTEPTPDLVPDSVNVSPTGLTGQPVTVTWRVKNNGDAVTGALSWSDRVYLSANGKFDADSIALDPTFSHSGALNPGDSYSQSQSVKLPLNLAAGSYTVFVQADTLNQVPELVPSSHKVAASAGPVVVSLSPAADLAVTSVSATSSTAVIGQSFTFSWTVKNQGDDAATAPWTDKVYLSPDGKLSDATLLVSPRHTTDLAVNGQYTLSQTVDHLPVLADGNYTLIAVTNALGDVFERNTANDTLAAAQTIAVQHPDLVVENVSATPAGPYQTGDAVTVSWVDHNVGSGPTTATWTDKVFLSKAGTLSGAIALTPTPVAHSGILAAAGKANAQAKVTLPEGVTGSYRFLVQTNAGGDVVEGAGSNNNVTASAPFTITQAPYADLTVHDVKATPSLLVGDRVDLTVSWSVTNNGTGPGKVDHWNDRVVLSASGAFGSGNNIVLTPDVPHQGLMPAGTSYDQSAILHLPTNTSGRFHVLVKTNADGTVFEGPGPFQEVAGADHTIDVTPKPFVQLVVNPVMADPTGKSGQPLTVSWKVTNTGIVTTDLSQWNDTVFLSTDPTGKTGIISLPPLPAHIGALGVNESYTRTAQVTLPKDLATGTYLVFVNSSGPYQFLHDDQDTGRSGPVAITFVPPPPVDLQVADVHVGNSEGPSAAQDGDTIDVSWTVKNNGPQDATGDWSDTLTLIPTGGTQGGPIQLPSFRRVGGLVAGISYTRTETITLPQHLQGVYLLQVQTDSRNEIAETDKNPTTGADANDTLKSAPLTVTLHPRPNLAVSINQATQQVTAGGAIDITWTVTNLGGPTPVGNSRWNDTVYVSLTNTLSASAIALTPTVANGSALDNLEQYRSSAPAPTRASAPVRAWCSRPTWPASPTSPACRGPASIRS
jgi:hypothetical protein